MIYLILQTVFASAFTLVIKWAQLRRREDIISIGAINYIVAALAIVPTYLLNHINESASLAATSLSGSAWISASAAAWLTGSAMGACYFIAYFFVIYAIRVVGAASTTVVAVLSILFPISLAAWIWNEVPTGLQVMGIALALVALVLIGFRNRQPNAAPTERVWITPVVLATFFLLCGFNRLAQETFKHLSEPGFRPTFVLAAFTVAAIPSAIVLITRRRRIQLSEFGLGALMGTANMLQTHLILNCLEHYPGFVVFTVTSAGAIVLTTLIATSMLQERLSRQTVIGILLSVMALVMLQWNF